MITRGWFVWNFFIIGESAPTIDGYIALDAQAGTDVYPQTRNGITAGRVSPTGNVGVGTTAAWLPGDDVILRGIASSPFSGPGTSIWRLDLPAGEYDFRLGIGPRTYYTSNMQILDSDGVTPLYTINIPEVTEPEPTGYYAIDGNLYPLDNAFDGPTVRRTVTGNCVFLSLTAPAGAFRNAISFFSATSTTQITATTFRLLNNTTPWFPNDVPSNNTPYDITFEAWDGVNQVRDTAYTGSAQLSISSLNNQILITSGTTNVSWSSGLATFNDVTFTQQSPTSGSPVFINRPQLFGNSLW